MRPSVLHLACPTFCNFPQPSYPLPAGWVKIALGEGAEAEEPQDVETFHPPSSPPDDGCPFKSIGGNKTTDIVDTDSDSTDVAFTDTNSMPPPLPPPPPPSSRRTTSKIFCATAGGDYHEHNPQQRQERHLRTRSDSAASSAAAAGSATTAGGPTVTGGGAPSAPRARTQSRGSFGSPGRVSWYENTWTGERVSKRPLYPAGPSEACVVSQVPRALDPLTFLADPVKGDGGRVREVVGETSSWSFSSFKTRGVAAAAQCLSQCVVDYS